MIASDQNLEATLPNGRPVPVELAVAFGARSSLEIVRCAAHTKWIESILSLWTYLFFIFLVLLTGCYATMPTSRASIAPTPAWHMEEMCGYEGCGPMVDVLKSKTVDIRLESDNGTVNSDIFTITVGFMTPEDLSFRFDPSLSHVTLPNTHRIAARGFPCSYTIYRLDTFRSDSFIKGPIVLNGHVHNRTRYDCFILFFDIPPPAVEQKFELNLDGLYRDGEQISIPEIQFSKGAR